MIFRIHHPHVNNVSGEQEQMLCDLIDATTDSTPTEKARCPTQFAVNRRPGNKSRDNIDVISILVLNINVENELEMKGVVI